MPHKCSSFVPFEQKLYGKISVGGRTHYITEVMTVRSTTMVVKLVAKNDLGGKKEAVKESPHSIPMEHTADQS